MHKGKKRLTSEVILTAKPFLLKLQIPFSWKLGSIKIAFHQCVSRSVVLVTKGHNPTEILAAQSPHHLVLIASVGWESVRQREDWKVWGPLSLGGCFTHTSPGMNQQLTSAGTIHQLSPRGLCRLGLLVGCWLGSGE